MAWPCVLGDEREPGEGQASQGMARKGSVREGAGEGPLRVLQRAGLRVCLCKGPASPRSSHTCPGSLQGPRVPQVITLIPWLATPAGLASPRICLEGRSPAAATRCSGYARRAPGGCWCSHRYIGASASACRTRGLQRGRQRRPRSEEPAGSRAAGPPARGAEPLLRALAQHSESSTPGGAGEGGRNEKAALSPGIRALTSQGPGRPRHRGDFGPKFKSARDPVYGVVCPCGLRSIRLRYLGLRRLSFCLRNLEELLDRSARARVRTHTHTHTDTIACEISLDSGVGEGGARPSSNRAAGQEQTEGNTEAHAHPRGVQVRMCGQPGGPSAPGHGPHRRHHGDTVTCCCSRGARRELQGEATCAPFEDGEWPRASGEWPGHWGDVCGRGKRPREAHSSAGPAGSCLPEIHHVRVYLSVWLCVDTTLNMGPDADNGSPKGGVRATCYLLRVSILCAFLEGICTVV